MVESMLKGNLMVDALRGLMVVAFSLMLITICIQSISRVEQRFFDNWQVEEDTCEIWCDSFWFYDD